MYIYARVSYKILNWDFLSMLYDITAFFILLIREFPDIQRLRANLVNSHKSFPNFSKHQLLSFLPHEYQPPTHIQLFNTPTMDFFEANQTHPVSYSFTQGAFICKNWRWVLPSVCVYHENIWPLILNMGPPRQVKIHILKVFKDLARSVGV
jgi:hypothetical protein